LKILEVSAKGLFTLCLAVFLLTVTIGGAVNSLWLYKYGFEKYGISQSTGLAETELDKAARGLISYFNSGEEYISLTVIKDDAPFDLFNQREIVHLKDVKGLIWLDYWVLLGTLMYVLAYAGFSLFWRKEGRSLAWGMVGGSSLILALMLAAALGTLLNFDQLFLQFHFISFANEFWMLDPSQDYLIKIFPQGFWFDVALFYFLTTAGLAVILGGMSGWYLNFGRRRL
jgi:integral membrane protein (TIGR01906 family)